jgi:hypothetical protein
MLPHIAAPWILWEGIEKEAASLKIKKEHCGASAESWMSCGALFGTYTQVLDVRNIAPHCWGRPASED